MTSPDDPSTATLAPGRITELAFAPSDPRLAWAGDSACRMYRSADGGQTWNEVTPLPPVERLSEVDAIAIHPTTPSTVIAGVYEEGARDAATSAGFLFRTTDDGVTWPHIGQDLHDDAGKLVGVRAVEIDPEHPDTVYAGTDIGVFRSTDGGTHWAPFNEGLPNARVSDLAYDRSGRLLRAGMWGRGVYERHVGTEPVKDVRLYVRSTTMDDGWAQPRPGPDLSATQAVALPLDRSPDIKHTLLDPVRGVVIDGVELDEDIADEPVRVGFSFVSVQVNNRGAMSTSSARVALLWSFADDGPPELPATLWDALAAAPLTRNATFGTWTVIGDQTVPDPQAVDHHIVAPGAPRVVVFGRAPDRLEWAANVEEHRRVGFLALARSTEDPLPRGPASVLSLVQSEAKAAYRECAVVPAASDDRIVLRATTPTGMTVAAPGAGLRNAANGAAPFGLAAVAAPATIVELPTAGDFNLGGGNPFAFRLQIVHNATVRFEAGDPAFRNIGRAFADEVAMVINRSLIDAGLPVRATSADFPGFGSDAMVITPVGEAVVRIVTPSTAAGLLGLATNTDAAAATGGTIETPFASRGPWNLTPPAGVARTLQFRVTVVSDVQFPASTPEIPDLAHATARQVRAAIDRQCRLAGLRVVAEPRSTRLSVRGSATEPTVARVVTGSFALGDLAVSPVALADAPARAALFDVVTAHSTDALSAGGLNRLYLRSANVGNVDLANVRHRLYEIDVAASPLTFDRRGSEVTEPRAAGASGIAQIEWDVPATPGGTRLFVLAVADTAADAFDPATVRSFADLDELATFCARQPNIAIRELTVA